MTSPGLNPLQQVMLDFLIEKCLLKQSFKSVLVLFVSLVALFPKNIKSYTNIKHTTP